MTLFVRILALAPVMACLFPPPAKAQTAIEIGGQSVVTLHRPVVNKGVPEFASVAVAPGRGMEILEITANFPGKGTINVLASPGPAAAAKMIAQHDDPNGLMSLGIGAAFLIPYPNRVRGKLTADRQSITTEWQGHTLTLPVSPWGKPDAERPAAHGLIFKAGASDVHVKSIPDGEQVTGVIRAGDFGGHWLSKTDLVFTIRLTGDAIDIVVARVHIPGSGVAEVENYDNLFPTGRIKPVDGTPYDFRSRGGVPLGRNSYDDNWSKLEWKRGGAVVQVIDPAANYGLNVEALSPTIKTIQMYAQPAVAMVAIEPQFNFVDPFGKDGGDGYRDGDAGTGTKHNVACTAGAVRSRLTHRIVSSDYLNVAAMHDSSVRGARPSFPKTIRQFQFDFASPYSSSLARLQSARYLEISPQTSASVWDSASPANA
jgi:galactose mutarotase-like enzyme